jgi:hypothetical protein
MHLHVFAKNQDRMAVLFCPTESFSPGSIDVDLVLYSFISISTFTRRYALVYETEEVGTHCRGVGTDYENKVIFSEIKTILFPKHAVRRRVLI